jgi:hypothetical protein
MIAMKKNVCVNTLLFVIAIKLEVHESSTALIALSRGRKKRKFCNRSSVIYAFGTVSL